MQSSRKQKINMPIYPDKTYKVASQNSLIKEGGNGLNMFADNELVIDEGPIDIQVLIAFICEHLSGVIQAEYGDPQGRITVV